jgi:hypothetical protein
LKFGTILIGHTECIRTTKHPDKEQMARYKVTCWSLKH